MAAIDIIHRVALGLKTFARSRRGNMTLLGGFLFTSASVAGVSSVEIGNAYRVRAEMQRILDAATVVAARGKDRKHGTREAQKYFYRTVEARHLPVEDVVATFVFEGEGDDDEKRRKKGYDPHIKADVSFTIKSMAMSIISQGIKTSITTEATPQKSQPVEVALVLDVSGSMGWSTSSNYAAPVGARRIDALKQAVNGMFDKIAENKSADDVYVSVIPYSTSVDLTDQYRSHSASDQYSDFSAKRRVTPAGAGQTHGDYNTIWAEERWQSFDGSRFKLDLSKPSYRDQIPTFTAYDREAYGYYTARSAPSYFQPRVSPMPLTNDHAKARALVNKLEAYGGTAGHLGMAYGLYSLTPEWGDFWGLDDGHPAKFEDDTQKVLVMMTDGLFSNVHRAPMGCRWYDYSSCYWSDIKINDGGYGFYDAYEYFQTVCKMAREKGVIVYTVGLAVGARANKELETCAGEKKRHYAASNKSELVAAFGEIAKRTGEVRIAR